MIVRFEQSFVLFHRIFCLALIVVLLSLRLCFMLLVHYDRTPAGAGELSRDDWEARRVREARVGSTREEGGKSLYQPITLLERSSSSSRICATPMKDLWSIRP